MILWQAFRVSMKDTPFFFHSHFRVYFGINVPLAWTAFRRLWNCFGGIFAQYLLDLIVMTIRYELAVSGQKKLWASREQPGGIRWLYGPVMYHGRYLTRRSWICSQVFEAA